MASIHLQNIVKRYGAFTGVQHMSLDIQDEEFLVLLGPSGCGKTTLLNIIGCILAPSAGRVELDGARRSTANGCAATCGGCGWTRSASFFRRITCCRS